ncbi:RING finger protein 17-like [Teleopsis dalmanni]|uniref:RING finger protein 17-like n=1 Tax=Teleopsis dalmanni TaxID=139649 RepID=UPI0018CFBF1B|nr:RING finger protein 17-like [Teleopsis dalmanni]
MGSLYSYNFEILDFDINYPTQSELSLSSLDKMNIVKSSKILKKKRTPVKEKIPSYTILKKKTFDSNETIENFHEILSLPSADNPMGCVTFIKSPAMFYIQLKEHKPLIQQISNAYKSHSVDLSINNEFNDINTDVEVDSEIETAIEFEIEIDKLYIIHYTDSEYYRGLVKNVCINRVYNVYLVDLGLTVDVEVKSFRTIKQEHINIPYVAICCSMYNLVPKQGTEWDKDATMLFTQLTSNEVIVELNKNQSKITTGEWSVNIIALYQDNSYSMRDVLLYTGFAMEVSENGTTNHLAFARQEHCFQKRMLLNNQFVVCRICSIENPLEFYAMQEDLIKEKNDLNKSLNELYSEEEVLKTVFVGYIHMCCATQVDGVWYRARIVRINAGGVIDIFLVDEGKTITTKWNQLYELLKEFVKIKEFIFQCELLGVKPSQKNNYQWTNEALTEFKHLVQNPRVVIYINTKNSLNVYKVNLNVTKTSGDIDVAAELIKSGLCDPSGEYCDITNSGTKKQSDMIINSDNNFRMEMIETQTQIKYDEQNKNSIIRTPIEIVEIINPFEFYVYVKQLLPGIINFLYKLSSIDYFRPQKDLIWKENDHCIVKANVYVECVQQLIDERCDQKDYNFIYHRGIIMFCDTEHSIYDIFLRDYGKIIRNVEKSNIYIIPLADDNVSDSAQRCHLAAIQPINERKSWSKTAIDFFTRVVTNPSNELSATLYGTPDKSNNSLPIILWITSTDNNDALAPNQQNHAKLNSALVKMGHACCLKWVDFKDNILGTEWVIDKKDIIDDSLRKIFKTIEKQSTPDDNFLNTYASEHKSPKSLDSDNTYASNLIDLTPTKPTMLSPYFWRQRKLIQETYFEGNPTYIDYDGIIYMHKSIDKTQLHRMRLKLDKYFARYSNEMSFLMTDFGINQACIAKYSADNHTYRAIITAINQNEFKVLFIDYGNEEMVTLKDILPFAPYANIQAYADTYKLIGIGPKKGTKYSERVLDIIHKQIVGKSVMVRVSPSALTNKGRDYTWCSICDQATDLASMLLINRLVVLVKEENEPSNKMDTEILPLMSDDHNDDDDDCLVRCLRDIDDVSPIKEMSDLDDEYGNATSDFLNQNNNFDDLAQKFATSLDLLNTNHEDGEPTNEIDCTFLNNPPPPKKPMFTRNEYMKLKSDFDRNHILDAKNIIKKATNAESTLISKHHTEGFSNMCKEHLSISSDNLAEDNAENMPINTTITANDLERDISPFERFSPSKTSTVRTHSMLNIFTFPKLKKFRTSFKCTIIHIVQPDILYVVPTATEYEDLSLELDSLINAIAPKLNPLQNFNNNTPCLVQYAKDNRWYRAAIKNYNKRTNIATVTYADYLSVENVSVDKLKEISDQIKNHPLRFFKVHVVNVKKARAYYDRDVCAKLYWKLRTYTYKANVINNDIENNIIEIELYDLKNNNIFEKAHIKEFLE